MPGNITGVGVSTTTTSPATTTSSTTPGIGQTIQLGGGSVRLTAENIGLYSKYLESAAGGGVQSNVLGRTGAQSQSLVSALPSGLPAATTSSPATTTSTIPGIGQTIQLGGGSVRLTAENIGLYSKYLESAAGGGVQSNVLGRTGAQSQSLVSALPSGLPAGAREIVTGGKPTGIYAQLPVPSGATRTETGYIMPYGMSSSEGPGVASFWQRVSQSAVPAVKEASAEPASSFSVGFIPGTPDVSVAGGATVPYATVGPQTNVLGVQTSDVMPKPEHTFTSRIIPGDHFLPSGILAETPPTPPFGVTEITPGGPVFIPIPAPRGIIPAPVPPGPVPPVIPSPIIVPPAPPAPPTPPISPIIPIGPTDVISSAATSFLAPRGSLQELIGESAGYSDILKMKAPAGAQSLYQFGSATFGAAAAAEPVAAKPILKVETISPETLKGMTVPEATSYAEQSALLNVLYTPSTKFPSVSGAAAGRLAEIFPGIQRVTVEGKPEVTYGAPSITEKMVVGLPAVSAITKEGVTTTTTTTPYTTIWDMATPVYATTKTDITYPDITLTPAGEIMSGGKIVGGPGLLTAIGKEKIAIQQELASGKLSEAKLVEYTSMGKTVYGGFSELTTLGYQPGEKVTFEAGKRDEAIQRMAQARVLEKQAASLKMESDIALQKLGSAPAGISKVEGVSTGLGPSYTMPMWSMDTTAQDWYKQYQATVMPKELESKKLAFQATQQTTLGETATFGLQQLTYGVLTGGAFEIAGLGLRAGAGALGIGTKAGLVTQSFERAASVAGKAGLPTIGESVMGYAVPAVKAAAQYGAWPALAVASPIEIPGLLPKGVIFSESYAGMTPAEQREAVITTGLTTAAALPIFMGGAKAGAFGVSRGIGPIGGKVQFGGYVKEVPKEETSAIWKQTQQKYGLPESQAQFKLQQHYVKEYAKGNVGAVPTQEEFGKMAKVAGGTPSEVVAAEKLVADVPKTQYARKEYFDRVMRADAEYESKAGKPVVTRGYLVAEGFRPTPVKKMVDKPFPLGKGQPVEARPMIIGQFYGRGMERQPGVPLAEIGGRAVSVPSGTRFAAGGFVPRTYLEYESIRRGYEEGKIKGKMQIKVDNKVMDIEPKNYIKALDYVEKSIRETGHVSVAGVKKFTPTKGLTAREAGTLHGRLGNVIDFGGYRTKPVLGFTTKDIDFFHKKLQDKPYELESWANKKLEGSKFKAEGPEAEIARGEKPSGSVKIIRKETGASVAELPYGEAQPYAYGFNIAVPEKTEKGAGKFVGREISTWSAEEERGLARIGGFRGGIPAPEPGGGKEIYQSLVKSVEQKKVALARGEITRAEFKKSEAEAIKVGKDIGIDITKEPPKKVSVREVGTEEVPREEYRPSISTSPEGGRSIVPISSMSSSVSRMGVSYMPSVSRTVSVESISRSTPSVESVSVSSSSQLQSLSSSASKSRSRLSSISTSVSTSISSSASSAGGAPGGFIPTIPSIRVLDWALPSGGGAGPGAAARVGRAAAAAPPKLGIITAMVARAAYGKVGEVARGPGEYGALRSTEMVRRGQTLSDLITRPWK